MKAWGKWGPTQVTRRGTFSVESNLQRVSDSCEPRPFCGEWTASPLTSATRLRIWVGGSHLLHPSNVLCSSRFLKSSSNFFSHSPLCQSPNSTFKETHSLFLYHLWVHPENCPREPSSICSFKHWNLLVFFYFSFHRLSKAFKVLIAVLGSAYLKR